MDTVDSPRAPAPHKYRWFQYRLSTLMLVVTAAAIFLGVWTNRVRKQQRAVAAIRQRGGMVYYSYESGPAGPNPTPPGPAWLRDLLGIDYLDHVVAVVCDVATDADLEPLEGLPYVESLWVVGQDHVCRVTDAGLAPIGRLRHLRNLSLHCDEITDAGLEHLESLDHLEALDILDARITDAGLAHLRPLRELKDLTLLCAITDAGMEHLTPLTNLTRLKVGNPYDPQKSRRVFEALPWPTPMDF